MSEWVRKFQNFADVMYGWSPRERDIKLHVVNHFNDILTYLHVLIGKLLPVCPCQRECCLRFRFGFDRNKDKQK